MQLKDRVGATFVISNQQKDLFRLRQERSTLQGAATHLRGEPPRRKMLLACAAGIVARGIIDATLA
jgi:hypothetical protein